MSSFAHPLSPASSDQAIEEIEANLPLHLDLDTLTTTDIKEDPILASLAKHQTRTNTATPPSPAKHGFKAKPAPASTRAEGLGPRMTKAAALRLGLKWEASPRKAQTPDGQAARANEQVPGYKRDNLKIQVASLAAPVVTPRPTRASQLRTGAAVSASPVRRDPAIVIAENKAKAEQEKLRRRASIALPASLSAPQIAPRQNRSSQLRALGPLSPGADRVAPLSSFARPTPLTPTSATNVGLQRANSVAEDKLKRRQSVAGTVRSLGAPAIQPRLNRAAMLRAPNSVSTLPSTRTSTSLSSLASPVPPSPKRPKLVPQPSATSASGVSASSSASAGPRPTKASLLRANLGAKISARRFLS